MANKMCKNCQAKKDVDRLVLWKWRPSNRYNSFSEELVDDNAIYREFIANEMGESARRTLEKYTTLYLGRTLGKDNAPL